MNTTLRHIIILIFLSIGWMFSGCISVSIKPAEFSEAQSLRVTPPPVPFREVKTMESDRSWVHAENGNRIAYVSECGSSGSDLKSIARSVVAPTKMKITAQNSDKKLGLITEALHAEDQIRLRLITRKTANCVYNFAYVGRVASFHTDEKTFEEFVNSAVLE